MTAVAFTDVQVVLGDHVVIDGISAEIHSGEWVALIGPNGAGKTTLLRACAGLLEYRGAIVFDGEPLARKSRREIAQLVALVPQSPATPAAMTVADYVLLGRTPHIGYLGGEGSRDRHAAWIALERLGLSAFAERALGSLSGGERQRAVLARALAQDAHLLLLDEPTSALDLGRQQQVLELVDELRRDHDLTVVAAMHDLSLAAQYAERLLLLDAGRVVADGSPVEVLSEQHLAALYGATVRIHELDGDVFVLPRRERV